jgi:hypothetical protein
VSAAPGATKDIMVVLGYAPHQSVHPLLASLNPSGGGRGSGDVESLTHGPGPTCQRPTATSEILVRRWELEAQPTEATTGVMPSTLARSRVHNNGEGGNETMNVQS